MPEASHTRQDAAPDRPERREAMATAAKLLGGGAVAAVAAGAGEAAARENRKGDMCLTVMFPNGEGAKFDFEYYVDHHVPLVLKLYGSSIRRYEVFQPETGPEGEAPEYLAITHIWIADPEAFARASAEHRDEFAPDVPNFTNVTPAARMHRLYSVIKT